VPQVKIEDFLYFGPNEMEDIIRITEQRAFEKAEKKKKKKGKRAIMPNPPGSTLCTEQSLSELRVWFNLGEVTLRVPSPDECAHNPPEGFYTLYARSFEKPPRDPRWIDTISLLLRVGRLLTGSRARTSRIPITSSSCPLKMLFSTNLLRTVLTRWRTLGRCSYYFVCARGGFVSVLTIFPFVAERTIKFLEPIPASFALDFHALSARKCDWLKHFSRDQIERALRLVHGVSCPSSSESSDHRTQFFVDMQSTKLTLREVYAKKKEDKERRLAEEKCLADTGLISPQAAPEATQDGKVVPDATAPVETVPTEAQEADPPSAVPTPEAVVALHAS